MRSALGPLLLLFAGAAAAKSGTLEKQVVVRTMNAIRPKTNGCFDQVGARGLVAVEVTIEPSGKVSSAEVSYAELTGGSSSVGGCLSAAVGAVTFPKFAGPAQTLTYPFAR